MKFYDKIAKYKRYIPSIIITFAVTLCLLHCFVSLLYLPIRSINIKTLTIGEVVLTPPYEVDDLCLIVKQSNPNHRLFPFVFYGNTQNTDSIKNQRFYIDDSNFITCSLSCSEDGSFVIHDIMAEAENMKRHFSVADCVLGETTRKEVEEKFYSFLKLKNNNSSLTFKVENYVYSFVFKNDVIKSIKITQSVTR